MGFLYHHYPLSTRHREYDGLIPLAAALLAACAGATPEPATEAPGPAEVDLVALPNAIEQDGIEVAFVDSVPEGEARLILAEALRARAAIDEYFGLLAVLGG